MRFLPSSQEVYGQFADAPRWYRILIRLRFLLAGVYLLTLLGTLGFVGQGMFSDGRLGEDLIFVGVTVVLFATQAMLLAGAPQLRRVRPIRRRHKAVSLIAGAFGFAGITVGFAATFVSLTGRSLDDLPEYRNAWWAAVLVVGVPWAFWFAVFAGLWAGRWTTGFGWMYRVLIAGTFAEVLFTVPVDIAVRKRTSCYCDEGTFWALIIGATSALWSFGPGVALLFLAVRLKRRQKTGLCVRCGYDLRGLPEARCPECGTPFEREGTAMGV